ncbi:MAG: DnaJ domain-containing protein [Alphaproteobacteria bacterium]|nr:DnaJ domain-containing protein [Alphaproteobacteria bacterium]
MLFDCLKYFELLGADEYTNEAALKAKYHEKAKFWHPDRNTSPQALEIFQKLTKAYDVLKNPKLRTLYCLLSIIYDEKTFPNIDRLNTYKSAKGIETPYLRVFSMQKVEKGKIITENLIGTYDDALMFLRQNTVKNFLCAVFNPKFYKTLKHNIESLTDNSTENLKVLVHNAAAFYDENKLKEAYLSALQALEYASKEQKEVIENFMKLLPKTPYVPQKFEVKRLREVQLKPYLKLIKWGVLLVGIVLVFVFGWSFLSTQDEKIDYYQTVQFNSGAVMADDMVANKIFNVPVDKTSMQTLYHVTSTQNVMYGPAEQFDVLGKVQKGQTVRMTGYTPDKVWVRVMLDDGQTGFIQSKYLRKGVGNPIPEKSQLIGQ